LKSSIGPYTIRRELGRGGMGVVYLGYEESLQREVAIKVLSASLASDEQAVQRFLREARSAASLSHPNVVQVYAVGEDAGEHYFAMEFVRGASVLQIIRNRGSIPFHAAAAFIMQAASGLAAAHEKGIIHRDIKPANLMVDELGLLKITDFGLALLGERVSRLTATGMLIGTPGYLSPEQCLDEEVDHRTDIYSLGVSFFEMLSGKMPFSAGSPLALMQKIVNSPPPDIRELNPDIPVDLREILGRMMARKPDERYQSCSDLITGLQRFLGGGRAPQTLTLVDIVASVTADASAQRERTSREKQGILSDKELETPTLPLAAGTGAASSSSPPTESPNTASMENTGSQRSPLPWIVIIILLILLLLGTGFFLLKNRPVKEKPVPLPAPTAVPSTHEAGPAEATPTAEKTEATPIPESRPTPTPLSTVNTTSEATPVSSAPTTEKTDAIGVGIITRGESLLTTETVRLLQAALARRSIPIVADPLLSELAPLNTAGKNNARIRKGLLAAGVRYLLIIDAKKNGERPLRFMGREETAIEATLSIACLDIATIPFRRMGGMQQDLVYTKLNLERKLRPVLRKHLPPLLKQLQN